MKPFELHDPSEPQKSIFDRLHTHSISIVFACADILLADVLAISEVAELLTVLIADAQSMRRILKADNIHPSLAKLAIDYYELVRNTVIRTTSRLAFMPTTNLRHEPTIFQEAYPNN